MNDGSSPVSLPSYLSICYDHSQPGRSEPVKLAAMWATCGTIGPASIRSVRTSFVTAKKRALSVRSIGTTLKACGKHDNIPIVGQRDGCHCLVCAQCKCVLIQVKRAIVPLPLPVVAIKHSYGLRLATESLGREPVTQVLGEGRRSSVGISHLEHLRRLVPIYCRCQKHD